MSTYGVCKLCLEKRELRDSHIIPRAFLKKMKRGGSGQLVEVPLEGGRELRKVNYNPSELMLCPDCEHILSVRYEKPGVEFLRGRKGKVVIKDDCLKMHNFDYKAFYIFLISMLWRASISKEDAFSRVGLDNFDELLRRCVRSYSLKVNESLRLNDFVAVSLLRLYDGTGTLDDEQVKKMQSNFGMESSVENNAFVAYVIIEGFLISYVFDGDRLEKGGSYWMTKGELVNRKTLRVPKCDMYEFSMFFDLVKRVQGSGFEV